MSAVVEPDVATPSAGFGIAPESRAKLLRLFESAPGVRGVWIFGSRAQGAERPESDIDLAVDAPALDAAGRLALADAIERLGLLYRVDLVFWQDRLDERFRARIERDRAVFWQPARNAAQTEGLAPVGLKDFQRRVLDALARYVDELRRQRAQTEAQADALRALEGADDTLRSLADFPARAWNALRAAGALPPPLKGQSAAHSSRFDGAGRAIPNLCLKVPTGGGKTLLAAAAVAQLMQSWFRRHTGLVLWVVPNEAIYRQTLAALRHRDHPYRQMLNVAAAGRVKVLEKTSPLTRQDTDGCLCVLVLMLQSAARASKETLKFFRDRGNVLGFMPRDDDVEAHWELLRRVPNLDVYAGSGVAPDGARAQKGSIVKSSLGNVMRLLRPLVVIDEGHHAYSETALATIDGFNPGFMLELSATPRLASARAGGSGSNVLVDVRGTDLDQAEMIKLPIQLEVNRWSDWQACLAAALQRLDDLQREADTLRARTARYIRPIMLVQVERTGADQRDAGLIHADDVREQLLRLGLAAREIAVKTSERNDLAAPENIDLLSPACEVRVIVTKQALQEGWDCPFAYVLCALAAGRNLAAMTQLVGRILRMPQVARTGLPALDSCWVLCHDAATGAVVGAVKAALEADGMGDLGLVVRSGDSDPALPRELTLRRRARWHGVRLFLPTVSWVGDDGSRRALVYDSDVLARVAWDEVRSEGWLADWAPDPAGTQASTLTLGLELLDGRMPASTPDAGDTPPRLDRARVVRALADLAPNPWHAWAWVEAVVARLNARGLTEPALARSTPSLIDALRVALGAERDRLAEARFVQLLAAGRIEFRLRADAQDYELPQTLALQLTGAAQPWVREADGQPMQRTLYEPALRLPDLNEFEHRVAGWLDQQQAVRWWHRNIARAQLGLQGWKRAKVYPDFVFAVDRREGGTRIVLLETKGLHLANEDTAYKRALLTRLTEAYADARWQSVGRLELESGSAETVVCDLVFDAAWQGALAARHFA